MGMNKRGQAIVEGALVISIVLILLLAVVSVGLYIYNMSVYAFAANKTMDMGISKLYQNAYYDDAGYRKTCLYETDEEEMKEAALDALSLTTGVEKLNEENVAIMLVDYEYVLDLHIILTGKYNLGISGFGLSFPEYRYELTYSYYY